MDCAYKVGDKVFRKETGEIVTIASVGETGQPYFPYLIEEDNGDRMWNEGAFETGMDCYIKVFEMLGDPLGDIKDIRIAVYAGGKRFSLRYDDAAISWLELLSRKNTLYLDTRDVGINVAYRLDDLAIPYKELEYIRSDTYGICI